MARTGTSRPVEKMLTALEGAGVEFIDENGGGAGSGCGSQAIEY